MKKFSAMPLKAGLFSLACALISNSATAKDIASTSLCGDAYVLAIAPSQVKALSWQSRDALSMAPKDKQDLPQAWSDIERLIALSPDIVIFGPGEGGQSTAVLQSAGIETVELKWGEDFASVSENIERLGTAIGAHNSKAAEIFSERVTILSSRASNRPNPPKVLYLSRAGGTAGPGTYVDAAITAAGGMNVITTPSWTSPDPEQILAYDPDLIVTSFFTDGYESVQANGARHSAVRTFIENRPRVDIPGALWPCAGPGLIEAAELIADALDDLP